MAEEQNCHDGPELCRSEPVETRLQIQVIHSALKLEKSAVSKVQKHIFCHFKHGKKSIFAPETSLKLPKMQISDFFLVQKLILCHF